MSEADMRPSEKMELLLERERQQLSQLETQLACCAHLKVVYERLHYESGACSDSWKCADCGQKFTPESWRTAPWAGAVDITTDQIAEEAAGRVITWLKDDRGVPKKVIDTLRGTLPIQFKFAIEKGIQAWLCEQPGICLKHTEPDRKERDATCTTASVSPIAHKTASLTSNAAPTVQPASAAKTQEWTYEDYHIVCDGKIIGYASNTDYASRIVAAHNATLRQQDDTKRLDWLERNQDLIFNGVFGVGSTIREAIDADMPKEI